MLASSAMAAPATVPTSAPATRPVSLNSGPADLASAKVGRDNQPDPTFLRMHEQFLARGKSGPIGVLFLGDSITQWWTRAPDVWQTHYGALQPANFGISGDRTQHVLWRIDHGELDGIHPKVVVLMIGTNNYNYSPGHITEGVEKIVAEIHAKLPDTKLLLLGIFPRGRDPSDPTVAKLRDKIKQVNGELAKLDDGKRTRYLDINDKFLDADGKIPDDVMPDKPALHPNAKGYQIWADAMQPLLDEMMKG
jgi:beta-glucosidase